MDSIMFDAQRHGRLSFYMVFLSLVTRFIGANWNAIGISW